MYGLLIESLAEFTKRNYGESLWDNVRKKAKIDTELFNTQQQYSEKVLMKLVKVLAEMTGISHYIF